MDENKKHRLEEFIQEALKYIDRFQKETYEDAFIDFSGKFADLAGTIAEDMEQSRDVGQTALSWAEALADVAAARLLAVSDKSRRRTQQLDYNMALAVYILPFYRQQKENEFLLLAKETAAGWNRKFPGQKVQAASFEQIQQGFKDRLCYITTAVCMSTGRGDHCYELELLRDYRDGYLLKNKEYEPIVREYYNIAPTIVRRIEREPQAKEIYMSVWKDYLLPCVQLIETGELERCRTLYTAMVERLRDRFLIHTKEEQNEPEL